MNLSKLWCVGLRTISRLLCRAVIVRSCLTSLLECRWNGFRMFVNLVLSASFVAAIVPCCLLCISVVTVEMLLQVSEFSLRGCLLKVVRQWFRNVVTCVRLGIAN